MSVVTASHFWLLYLNVNHAVLVLLLQGEYEAALTIYDDHVSRGIFSLLNMCLRP